MTTPYWSDFVPNSTFYRILSGFHRTFATGVACRQGTLTPPDTWSRPFGICICSTCWDQTFSELVAILPDYALRISLGTFSILPYCKCFQLWSFYKKSFLSNMLLTSFDVLITVIRHQCRDFWWQWLSEMNRNKISRVQRREYDTIVHMSRVTHKGSLA